MLLRLPDESASSGTTSRERGWAWSAYRAALEQELEEPVPDDEERRRRRLWFWFLDGRCWLGQPGAAGGAGGQGRELGAPSGTLAGADRPKARPRRNGGLLGVPWASAGAAAQARGAEAEDLKKDWATRTCSGSRIRPSSARKLYGAKVSGARNAPRAADGERDQLACRASWAAWALPTSWQCAARETSWP